MSEAGKNKRSFPPLTFRLRFVVPVKGSMCAGMGIDLASNAPCVEKQRALWLYSCPRKERIVGLILRLCGSF